MGILSTNVTHGFKTALAAVLAYSITTILALEFGYWAVISTVIVMQVYVADSVEMCFYRFSGTIIGATLGVTVLLVIPKTPIFIFPKRKVDMLRVMLEKQAKECADRCLILVDAFISKQQNVEESPIANLVNDVWGNHALLQKAYRHESLIYHKKFHENLTLKVAVISRSAEHLRNMARALNALDDDGYEIILSQELIRLAEKSGEALILLIKNDPLTVKGELERMESDLDEKLIHIRKEGLIHRFDYKKLIQVFSFYSSLLYFTDDILSGINKFIKEH